MRFTSSVGTKELTGSQTVIKDGRVCCRVFDPLNKEAQRRPRQDVDFSFDSIYIQLILSHLMS